MLLTYMFCGEMNFHVHYLFSSTLLVSHNVFCVCTHANTGPDVVVMCLHTATL